MIDEKIIEDILSRVDIVDVVTDYVPNLKKAGASYTACCPFHNEKTPSFRVFPATGKWHCFGACQEGGNAVKFVMKIENVSFPIAIKKLAAKYGIYIKENHTPPSDEDRRKQMLRETQLAINEFVALFYAKLLSENKDAKKYVVSRWGENFFMEEGLGFAPDHWDDLLHEAESKGYSIEVMLQLGLLKKSEKGKIYDAFRNRIMIPIRDSFSRIIAFTARDLSGKEDAPKYINSPTSELYSKDQSIFGIHSALKTAIKESKFYLVEGAPDVMRLQSIGIYNTVASLGSAWTDNQLKVLKKYATSLCFLPDADSVKQAENYGTGIKSVIKNGTHATLAGFNVTVREIPLGEGNTKQDPDSFCTTLNKFNLLDEEDFIMWFARYEMTGKENAEEVNTAIGNITKLVARIEDDMKVDLYISKLTGAYKNKDIWRKGVKLSKKQAQTKSVIDKCKSIDRDLYGKYGFFEQGLSYYSISKEGNEFQWSNFTLEPLFHIKDSLNPKRIYKIKNALGYSEIIEMKQEDLISLPRFKARVEGLGNYIWLAGEREMTKLKMFLYEQTETAKEIVQLGWQREDFFAFGNGVFDTEWHASDEYGIVRLDENKNYYLPSSSVIYRQEKQLFQFERNFIHLNYSGITLRDYSEKLIRVFGDRAKVGLCFLLATLFRDIIVDYTKTFPILNLFGPKGTGKTEMGHALMSFFIANNTAPNIQNATIASMADLVAQCANALVHIDEYKNSIDVDKREFLKGLWDGAGRSRMNMDRDKKREITRVDSGVILSGQEMATADIALFSRFVYLTFDKDEHDQQERLNFADLETARKRGCTHLTLQILRHRALMQSEFVASHKQIMKDLQRALQENVVEDRILKNWAIPLVAFYILSPKLDLPFSYQEMLQICTDGILNQNQQCKRSNDLSNFWNTISYLLQDGYIFHEADYRISYSDEFKTNISSMEFKTTKRILLLRLNRVIMKYKKVGREVGDSVLPQETIKSYLEHSKEYLGYKNSVRFKNITNGQDVIKAVPTGQGTAFKKTSTVDRAICFDYDMLQENFGIHLEIDTDIE